MLKGKFISNCLTENIDDIKFAALYYDQIDILENYVVTFTKPDEEGACIVRGVTPCIHENFASEIKLLKEEGIVKIYEFNDFSIKHYEERNKEIPELEKKLLDKTYDIMGEVGNQLFEIKNNNHLTFRSKEVVNVHQAFIGELKINSIVDLQFLFKYYANLIFEMLLCIYKGDYGITSSRVVNDYFNKYYLLNVEANKAIMNLEAYKGNLGVRTIQQLVPDVSKLSFDEILELREKCKDELANYRFYMSQLNEQLVNTTEYDKSLKDTNNFVENKVGVALRELEQKILKSNISVGRYFLDGLKDIKSYTPFVGSLFLNVPFQITSLLSLGLIGAGTYLKWKEENVDIKNNGLYYLYDIKRNV